MKIKLSWVILIFGLLLSACSSTSAPPLNIDNDFWFGEITRQGSSGTVFTGFGFKQTGSDIEATLALTNGTQAEVCCVLKGSLVGRKLDATYVDAVKDSVTVSGNFSDDGKNFTGILSFVVEGVKDDFNLQMAYQEELNAALTALSAGKSTEVSRVRELLE